MAIRGYLRLCRSYLLFPLGYYRYFITLYQVLRRRILSSKTKILTCTLKPMPHDFPQDILVEILHRLPLKSLVRFSFVCKAWNSLITDQSFIFDHLDRTIQARNESGSIFLKLRRYNFHRLSDFYSLCSDDQHSHPCSIKRFPLAHLFKNGYSMVVGTCHGLICMADYSNLEPTNTIVIWNPLIRKYMVLPEPNYVTCTNNKLTLYEIRFGFGFDSKNKDYKVVRLVIFFDKEYATKVDLYSLASRSWRSITAPQFSFHGMGMPQVFVNGAIHWLVCCERNGQIQKFILSFDVVGETFGELSLPQHLRESSGMLYVLGGGNSLSVLHSYYIQESQQCYFILWTMKECGSVESWNKVFCFGLNSNDGRMFPALALSINGKVFIQRHGVIDLVDPKTKFVKTMTASGYELPYVGSYVESLVFLHKELDVMSY